MRLLWVIFGVMTLCVGTVRGQDPANWVWARDSVEYRAAYTQGRAEADRELKNEAATIYSYGLMNFCQNLDRETGLPYCGLGCKIDDEILGRVYGHNDRIREYIKDHGVPKNSFKQWEKGLFGLEDYFKSRRKHEKAETPRADGPALKSPDGTCTIKLVAKSYTSDGKAVKRLSLELSSDGRKPKEVSLLADADAKTELFWGPKGSGWAVVAVEGARHDWFMAIDLRRASRLPCEFASRRRPPGTRLQH